MTIRHAMKIAGTSVAFTLALAFALPRVSIAADVTSDNVNERIASAKTAADHEAIAAYFRGEAAEQAERVKLHEGMLANYEKAGGKSYANIISHCKAMLAESRKLEKDYSAMADLHAKMAKSVGKHS